MWQSRGNTVGWDIGGKFEYFISLFWLSCSLFCKWPLFPLFFIFSFVNTSKQSAMVQKANTFILMDKYISMQKSNTEFPIVANIVSFVPLKGFHNVLERNESRMDPKGHFSRFFPTPTFG